MDLKATLSNDKGSASGELRVTSPHLWQLDDPYLYTLRTTVRSAGKVVDVANTRFGIRTLKFSKKEGFFLNGKHTRIRGVCLHHDNGPLGAVVYRRAIERKVQIMKQMGVNSIRTSHNPPSSELLDVCDELGVLVQVEAFDCWEMGKVPNGYNKFFEEWAERDIKDMVRRDRNHPSVFMWSIGNEILEQGNAKEGNRIAKMLNDYVKSIDTTRPTTCGFNYYPAPYKNGMANQIDIPGMNYKPLFYGNPVDTSSFRINLLLARRLRRVPAVVAFIIYRSTSTRLTRPSKSPATTSSALRGPILRTSNLMRWKSTRRFWANTCGPGLTISANRRPTAAKITIRTGTGMRTGRREVRISVPSICADFRKTDSIYTRASGLTNRWCTCYRIGTGRALRIKRFQYSLTPIAKKQSCSSTANRWAVA